MSILKLELSDSRTITIPINSKTWAILIMNPLLWFMIANNSSIILLHFVPALSTYYAFNLQHCKDSWNSQNNTIVQVQAFAFCTVNIETDATTGYAFWCYQ